MEHKSIQGQAVKASPAGTAEVCIATLGVIDHDGDVVAKGAIGQQVVPILAAHNWGGIPLGKASTYEQGNRVMASMKFNMDIPEARSWHSALMFDVAHGPAVQEYSWGYQPTKSQPVTLEGRRVRRLEAVELREVSMVIQGASIGSHTVGVKCTDCGSKSPADTFTNNPALDRELAKAGRFLREHDRAINAELQAIYDNLQLAIAYDESRDLLAYFYSEVEHPDPALARAGQACLQMCAAELGIAPPPLKWMVAETAAERAYVDRHGARDWDHLVSDERIYGAFQPYTGRVFVRADLSFDLTMQYLAHEVRHAAGGDEDEARAYQAEWASRLPADEARSR